MTNVSYTNTFVKNFRVLPKSIRVKTDELVGLLSIDFRDSRLHTKKLVLDEDIYSFRIGRDYRVLFVFESGDTIKLIDIQHRKDIYKGLKS